MERQQWWHGELVSAGLGSRKLSLKLVQKWQRVEWCLKKQIDPQYSCRPAGTSLEAKVAVMEDGASKWRQWGRDRHSRSTEHRAGKIGPNCW